MSEPADLLVGAIVVAAGRGERLGYDLPKALVTLDGQPLVAHAVSRLRAAGVDRIVIAAPPAHVETFFSLFSTADVLVIVGGSTRQASVELALAALDPAAKWVLVHDAARALAPASLATSVIAALTAGAEAVTPGIAVTDTVKSVRSGIVERTLDRATLIAVQTPQGFTRATLEAAHAGVAPPRLSVATDDAGLVEAMGIAVKVIPGSPLALKITGPYDLALAELMLATEATTVPSAEFR